MAVGVGHQLIGLLAGGIEAYRMVDRLTLMKWQITVTAINRTAGGINQIGSAVMATPFQQIPEPHQIALDVSRRILQGVTNTRLGRQVDHHLRTLRSKNGHKRIGVF